MYNVYQGDICKLVWVCMYFCTCSFQKDGWKATCFYLKSGGKSDIMNFGFVNDSHIFVDHIHFFDGPPFLFRAL